MAGRLDAGRFVFVDEMGSDVSPSPLYAWSRKGERAFGSVPRNWGKNVTLLSSMTRGGMGTCVAVEGATTGAVFEAYLEQALVPSLYPGQVVVMVMDNLSAHKGERVRQIVEGRGCERMYLPPYSPDLLNPIERAFSKVEALLCAGPQPAPPRGPGRGDGDGAICGHGPGRLGLLPALRLPRPGPTAMTAAVAGV